MKTSFSQILKTWLWHVPWLTGTFIISLFAAPAVLWFAGMGTGILVAIFLISLAVTHIIAFVIGLAVRKNTWRTIVLLCGIALLPPIYFGAIKLHDAWYVRFRAVYDRFRDNLANPIPNSVSHLEFVSSKEAFTSALFFRFDIAPDDLDKIIRVKGFRKIGVNEFARKDDLFTFQKYLPLSEPTSFYIHEDDYSGNVDILKVSSEKEKVIFRQQAFIFYTNEDWGNNLLIKKEEQYFIRQLSRTNHP